MQAPFDKTEVRKALNMAIDKQAILDAVYQGAGRSPRTRSRRPCGPTTTTIKDDEYDPEAAKKMLEEAGVKDLKMKIWAMPVQRPYNPERPAHGRTDPGRFRQGRCDGRDRLLRMGRISQAARRPRTTMVPCSSAGPATMAIRTTSSPCFSAATRSAATTAPQWCNQEFDGSDQEGARRCRTTPSAPSSIRRRRWSSSAKRRGPPSRIRSSSRRCPRK